VRDRLLDRSRKTGENFQFLLQRYAAERFLYRLGESRHRDRYVLKGATLFAIWGSAIYRGTRDLDFTGYGASEVGGVLAAMRDVCGVSVDDDGITFDAATLAARPIREEAEYNGLRVQFQARLGVARIPMQVDIGFGNAIQPPPTEADYPSLLDLPRPRIRAYPQEAVVAEKLHAMVVLGERNSRYKDFYDLYVFTRRFPFDGERLTTAIAATFDRRRTAVEPALPAALSARFYADGERAARWRAYLARDSLPGAPADWADVGELLQAFLSPPWRAIADARAFSDTWSPRGPWTSPHMEGPVVEENLGGTLQQFRPYRAYIDSGVEWLGAIPAHWPVSRIGELTSLVNGFPFESEYFVRGEGIPLVRIRDLDHSETEVNYIGPVIEDAWIEPGDVIIGMDGDFNVARWRGQRALLNQRMCCLRPGIESDAAFISYLLPFPLKVINDLTYSTTVKHLSSIDVRKIRIGTPPEPEQRAIATFLDRETARIDALVAKKEQLIALLQQKRIALITRAVTKGLDPNASMRDSGVKWLGEVPAHWEVKPLRWVLSIRSGDTLSSTEFDETTSGERTVPVIGGNGVMGYGNLSNVSVPSIAVGRVGALCGNVHLVNPPAWVTDNALLISEIRAFDREYLALLIDTLDLNRWASQSAQPLITGGFVKMQRVCCPPLPEQLHTVKYVGAEARAIDALTRRIADAIRHLQEFRVSLISATVTGKIDVREEAA
jgi:type I restriction enzyme S subunit